MSADASSRLHLTPVARSIDAVLRARGHSEGVVKAVLHLQEECWSTREIALWLLDETGIRVTHETVRGWAIEWQHVLEATEPEQEPAA